MLTAQSKVMLGLAALLGALNAADLRDEVVAGEALPSLPVVAPEAATRLTIGDQVNVLTIERGTPADPWRIVAPLDYPADERLVGDFVKQVGRGVPMDLRLDEGNLEAYGVDDQHALRADVWAGGAEPVITVFVGNTAGPGASFVRLPGSDAVYRADVGSRARYERRAADWRDRAVLPLEREAVTAFTVSRGSDVLTFSRGLSTGKEPGPFRLEGAAFPTDAESIESMLRVLVKARASELHNASYDGGFEQPVATVSLRDTAGATHEVVLGSRSDDKATLLRVSGRDSVYRTSGQVFTLLTQPVSALRDRTMGAFDRAAVASMSWEEGGLTVTLAHDEAAGTWVVTQPENVDADQRAALDTVSTLASLRARAVADDGAFLPSGTVATVTMRDGSTWTLSLGQVDEASGTVRARVGGRSEVFLLDARQLVALRAGFGRG